MNFTPNNLLDWRDRKYRGKRGILTFRLYAHGWLVTYSPDADPTQRETIEGVDIWTACRFANDREGY